MMNVPGCIALTLSKGSPSGSDGEESAQDVGDLGFISGLGRSPDEGMAAHNIILVWRSPWTEERGELQSVGSQESDTSERLSKHDALSNPSHYTAIPSWPLMVFATKWCLTGGPVVEDSPAKAGDAGRTPGWGGKSVRAAE